MAPRPARAGAGAYLPPHLRGGNASRTAEQRSLEEIAPHNMLIKLQYTANGPFSLDGCPDQLQQQQQQHAQEHQQTGQQQQQHTAESEQQHQNTTQDPSLVCVHLESPACPDTFQMDELLTWFDNASKLQQTPDFPKGDTRAILSLPASLSKYERARWHGAAQKIGLQSASKGVGADRLLQIKSRHTRQGDLATDASRNSALDSSTAGEGQDSNPDQSSRNAADDQAPEQGSHSGSKTGSWGPQQQQQQTRQPLPRHKQVWEWCQIEGGAFWNYSQGEVQELLADEANTPPDLQQLIHKRETSLALFEALQQRDESTALELLAAAAPGTKLGWVRDQQSGGYPAHIAAFHGLGKFIKQLVVSDGHEILQQHDARRNTPISLAEQRGHRQLAVELEQLRMQGLTHSNSASGPATIPVTAVTAAAAVGAGFGTSSRSVASGGGRGPAQVSAGQQTERYCSFDTMKDRTFVLFGRGPGANRRQNRTSSSRGGRGGEKAERQGVW